MKNDFMSNVFLTNNWDGYKASFKKAPKDLYATAWAEVVKSNMTAREKEIIRAKAIALGVDTDEQSGKTEITEVGTEENGYPELDG